MKYALELCLLALLLVGMNCSGSDADPVAGNTSSSAEEVVRQYQAHLDNNRFEEAKALSTRAEQSRLNDLERQLSPELDAATILHTRFLKIDCRAAGKTNRCHCQMEDEYERYEAVFILTFSNGRWLVDAPENDVEINDELIDDLLDEAFDRPSSNRKDYPQ